MNITFLIRDLHYGGGGERVAVNLANYFAEQGYQVKIVTIAAPEKENIFHTDQRIQIDYLNADFKKGLKFLQQIKAVFAVRNYFSANRQPGLILGIGTYANFSLAFVPKNSRRIGCQHCSFNSLSRKWRILGKLFFRKLYAIVSLTEEDVPNWRKFNKNIAVIPNAVSFYPDNAATLENKLILSVGRIDYLKGYDLLLDVFEKISKINKDWKLRIIGEGPSENQIKKRIESSGLQERIEIVPPTRDILNEYMNASLCVMTSRSEGFPMVLLEAKACGLPTVSFDIKTGPSEIIRDGIDGYLISAFDVDEMADRLLELTNDESKRKSFGLNAREDVKRFLPQMVGEKWKLMVND